MKRLYEFITKANQVLLFLCVLGVLAGLGLLFSSELFSSRHGPQVPVAQSIEESKSIVIDDVRFLGKRDDYFVLGIVKCMVASGRTSKGGSMDLYASSFKNGPSGQLVNVVFVRDGQKVRTLLENDGLVLTNQLSYSLARDEFRSHLFRCVTEDTNGNQMLDEEDRSDLYLVAHGLKQQDMVIKGVVDTDVITSTLFIVKVVDPAGIRFYEVDTETRTQKEIVWK